MIKKYLSAAGVGLFLIALAAGVAKSEVYEPTFVKEIDKEITITAAEAYGVALKEGPDLVFWYNDDSYESYFLDAAIAFYEKEGIAAELVYVDDVDYVGSIYDATMENKVFPDAYLLSGEELEKAYLYGLADVNANAQAYQDTVAKNAMNASEYDGELYGYPLSYNVCVFVYNKNFFIEKPASLQFLIDYSKTHEPSEDVQYMLEWDAYDPFFDFAFISESVSFEKKEAEVLEVRYDETVLETSMAFFKESLEFFSLPIETVTEESVLTDVLNGVTLCAVVDSDSLKQLEAAVDYRTMEFPAINDTLAARPAALTDMILVNDFSEVTQLAEKFAQFLTLEYATELWEKTGHYSVIYSENADRNEQVAYSSYEKAVLVPNSQDATGFWIDLKSMITNSFEEID